MHGRHSIMTGQYMVIQRIGRASRKFYVGHPWTHPIYKPKINGHSGPRKVSGHTFELVAFEMYLVTFFFYLNIDICSEMLSQRHVNCIYDNLHLTIIFMTMYTHCGQAFWCQTDPWTASKPKIIKILWWNFQKNFHRKNFRLFTKFWPQSIK